MISAVDIVCLFMQIFPCLILEREIHGKCINPWEYSFGPSQVSRAPSILDGRKMSPTALVAFKASLFFFSSQKEERNKYVSWSCNIPDVNTHRSCRRESELGKLLICWHSPGGAPGLGRRHLLAFSCARHCIV